MERSRITRYVRIAVSALSLMACVLLVVLWVRSYYMWENFHALPGGRGVVINSFAGLMSFGFGAFEPQGAWNWIHIEATEAAKRAWWSTSNYGHDERGFGITVDTTKVIAFAPHWFLVVMFAGIAVVPWLPSLRRFSLRTLLIATTLVAVGLGVVAALS